MEENESYFNEHDLKELERYIQDFWRFLPIPVCYVNPLHIILSVDKEFEYFSGYSVEEIVGESVDKLFANLEECKLIKETIIAKRIISNYKITFLTKTKRKVPVKISAMARVDEEDDIIGYFISLIDISESERYEEQLKKRALQLSNSYKKLNKAHQKLKELDKLKDEFVSSVSHELKSPLAAIEGYVELLLEKVEKNKIDNINQFKKALNIILENTERLSNFIERVLDLTKIKAGKITIEQKEINIAEICDEVVALFDSLARKRGLHFKKVITVKEPPIVIGDREKLSQVMRNLVSNAIKFTPSGKIEIRVEKEKENIKVSVIDTGIGIPKEKISNIFTRFERVKDGWEKLGRKVKGTGLGLTITKSLIEAHKGKLYVESDIGKGSKFFFTLPTVSH